MVVEARSTRAGIARQSSTRDDEKLAVSFPTLTVGAMALSFLAYVILPPILSASDQTRYFVVSGRMQDALAFFLGEQSKVPSADGRGTLAPIISILFISVVVVMYLVASWGLLPRSVILG
jgi:hypothetical protein